MGIFEGRGAWRQDDPIRLGSARFAMAPTPSGQGTRALGMRPVALLVALAMAILTLGVAAPAAQAVGTSVVLRSLVVTDGSAEIGALQHELDIQGIPYTLVDASAGAINANFLADGGQGNFQAVFLPDQAGGGLSAGELEILAAYEAEFGVRQVNAYDFPTADMGLVSQDSGTLDGSNLTLTAEGHTGPFSYLQSGAEIVVDDNDSGTSESFGYVPAPLNPMPPAQSFTPMVNVTYGALTGPVIGVFAHDGREEMVITISGNENMQWFNTIAEGIVSWATRGINLGFNRNYFNVHIDDVLLADERWSVEYNCTPGEDCVSEDPANPITTDPILMDAGDVDRLLTWQDGTGIQLDMVFNAGGVTATPSSATDVFLANKSDFRWINHTWNHQFLGCIQMRPAVVGESWTCAERESQVNLDDPSYPDGERVDEDVPWVYDPQEGDLPDYWMSQAGIEAQIQQNIAWATTNDLPNFDPKELVTGEHSGLKMLPTEQQPIDSPQLGPALSAEGIDYTASDASRDPDTRTVDNSSTQTVPRHPMNIFFNAGKFIDQVDEYNWIYAPDDLGTPEKEGNCVNSSTTTCMDAPLPAADNTEAETSFNSYIVPFEVRKALSYTLTNDPRPFYAHQSNLAEDGILYPVLNSLLSTYSGVYDTSATPLVQTGLTGQYQALQRMADWRPASAGVDAYVDALGVHVPAAAGSAKVPVTVPAGSTGAALESYAGAQSGWLDAETTITLPTTAGGYLPAPPPEAPTAVSGIVGDAQVALTWTAPLPDGGSPILGYHVQPYEGPTQTPLTPLDSPGTTPAFTVPGLTNGTEYRFDVTAYNALGDGPASATAGPFIPLGRPGAPTAVTAETTANDPALASDEVRVSWTPPVDNGGRELTGYAIQKYDAATGWTDAGTAEPTADSVVVGGLTKYNSWMFQVRAVNEAGSSDWATSNGVYLPPTVPGVPTDVTGVAVGGSVELSWTAPADEGGLPPYGISSYVVRVFEGDAVDPVSTQVTSDAGTTLAVSGLTNGTAYSFDVAAVNSIGTGAASVKSGVVTPVTVPSAPQGVSAAMSGLSAVTVSYAAPVSNGGSEVTLYACYAYTAASGGSMVTSGSTTSPTSCTLSAGLVAGTPYFFGARARNAVGWGPLSELVAVSGATVPSAPQGVSAAMSGLSAVTVSYAAPVSNGGSEVTLYACYAYTAASGGSMVTSGSTTSPTSCTLSAGLVAGTPYFFGARARNAVGWGPLSELVAVSGATVPSAPQGVSAAMSGLSAVTVSYAAPVSNGGSEVTLYACYAYTAASGGSMVTSGSTTSPTSCTLSAGLVAGTPYFFGARARNAVGWGPLSELVAVSGATVPSAPQGVSAARVG